MKFHTVLIIKTYQNYNWELVFKVAHTKKWQDCANAVERK